MCRSHEKFDGSFSASHTAWRWSFDQELADRRFTACWREKDDVLGLELERRKQAQVMIA